MFTEFNKSLLIILTGFFILITSCKKKYTCECVITDINGTEITTDTDKSDEKLTQKQAKELCAEHSATNADFIRTCTLSNIDL